MNKTQLKKYLLWAFLIAYIIQIGASLLYKNDLMIFGQLLVSVTMFAPIAAVYLSGYPLMELGWKPVFKGKIKYYLLAWFLPSILTALGAALYFLIFPEHFDLSGDILKAQAGEEALAEMEKQGLTYPIYVVVSIISCITYAPIVNMFFAVGEEAGWRGFMYPQLKKKFGRTGGLLLGGIIWGIWHWPLIWLIGYEYGTDYIGFPFTGMLFFCVTTIILGIICDVLYEKSGCIWVPAIFHGSFNAAATIPAVIHILNTGSFILLGPAPNGLIAEIPIIITAVIFLLKTKENKNS